METPENPEDKLPLEEVERSPSDYESLSQFVISILILVIVVSGTFNILLLRLWQSARTDANVLRPQFENFVKFYQNGDGPQIERVINTFKAFSATNPDYVPILSKYGFAPQPAAGTPPSLSAPPAGAPPAKK